MTSLITLLNRFENAAGVYERSDDPAARDELHAARRAIVEREAELVKALEPFEEIACEDNEDQPDDSPCIIRAGRSTHYMTTLGDFRRLRSALRATS